jgi:hypothetical protein
MRGKIVTVVGGLGILGIVLGSGILTLLLVPHPSSSWHAAGSGDAVRQAALRKGRTTGLTADLTTPSLSSNAGAAQPVPQGSPSDESQGQSPLSAHDGQPVSIMTIQNAFFTPNSLLAVKGQDISIELHAVDDTYGFNAPDLGIQFVVPQGQTVSVHLPTDKSGVFKFWDHLHPEPGDWSTWKARGTYTVQAP